MTTQPAPAAPQVNFDFPGFINQTIKVLTSPAEFFRTMSRTPNLVESIISAAIYGLVAGIFTAIWSLLHLGATAGVGGGAFGAIAGVGMIIIMPIMAVIGLFIGAVIALVIAAISGGKTDYMLCVKVTAAAMAVYPVNAALSIANINFYLGLLVNVVVMLYAFWIYYNALVHGLDCGAKVVKIILGILAAIAILFSITAAFTARALTAGIDRMGAAATEYEKAATQWGKEMEKAAADIQAAAEKAQQNAEAAGSTDEQAPAEGEASEEQPAEQPAEQPSEG